jgi:hypothetical protein
MSIRIGIGIDMWSARGEFIPIAEYQAILTETVAIGGTLPSLNVQKAHNKAIIDAIADGTWAITDYFIALQHDASTYHYGTVNWKNPTSAKATLVGTPTFRSSIGYKGNGTDFSILSEFTPLNGVNYQGSNCGVGFYGDDDFSNNTFLFGCADVSSRQVYLANFSTTNNWNAIMGSGTLRTVNNNIKAANHYGLTYDGSNVIVTVGSNAYSTAQTGAQTRPNAKITILGRNLQGSSVDGRVIKTVSYFYTGDSTVVTKWKAKLDTAFTAIRPAYSAYSLLSDIDINNTSIMWQDAAKTIPAVDGQPVRVISGGGSDWLASADTDRAILTANGLNSRRTLLFDGINDNYDFSTLSGDLALIFVYKNTNIVYGSQIMNGQLYLTVTGSGYSGNTTFGGEYTTLHPTNGSASAGVKLKNQGNAFNTIAHLRSGDVFQNVNGFSITGRNVNNSPLTLSNMGDPYNALWQVQGELARVLIYQGCPPDSVIEAKIFEMNALFNI